MRLLVLCILLCTAFLASCTSTKKSTEPAVQGQAPQGTAEVSGCKVTATIISIENTLDTINPESPCGKVPCIALIRIDQIVKMGQLCSPLVVPGAELKAYFTFTLGKTHELFPDMKEHFPGLEKNGKFAASFVATRDLSNNKNHIVINTYTKAE